VSLGDGCAVGVGVGFVRLCQRIPRGKATPSRGTMEVNSSESKQGCFFPIEFGRVVTKSQNLFSGGNLTLLDSSTKLFVS